MKHNYYTKYIKYKTKYLNLIGGAKPVDSESHESEYIFANFIKCDKSVNKFAADIFFVIIKKTLKAVHDGVPNFPYIDTVINMLEPELSIDQTTGELSIIKSGFASKAVYQNCVKRHICSLTEFEILEFSDDDVEEYLNGEYDITMYGENKEEYIENIRAIWEDIYEESNLTSTIIIETINKMNEPNKAYYDLMNGRFHQMIGGLYSFFKNGELIYY